MLNTLLDHDLHKTATVIVIDWRGGSSPPYVQAAANIRLIGAITAHVIHMLYEELGMKDLSKVHLIGHSLGSHLCGYAGYTMQRDFGMQIGRITGLDPAEPFFHDVGPLVRLDRTDAKYVDIIHTDAAPFVSDVGLGLYDATAHVDFYPNGGWNQPGCDEPMTNYIEQHKGSFFWGVQQFLGCNHIRSFQFFTESIVPKCPFVAIACTSYEDFRDGKCFECDKNGNPCFDFGFRSYKSYKAMVDNNALVSSEPIKVYLMTDSRKPYCRK
jgi:pancreatic triacylglycerol lipase